MKTLSILGMTIGMFVLFFLVQPGQAEAMTCSRGCGSYYSGSYYSQNYSPYYYPASRTRYNYNYNYNYNYDNSYNSRYYDDYRYRDDYRSYDDYRYNRSSSRSYRCPYTGRMYYY